MSEKTQKEAPRRTLTSLQSTGRIGRSTLKQGLAKHIWNLLFNPIEQF